MNPVLNHSHKTTLGASDEVQLGAFLHDIGHLIGIRGGKEKYPPMYDDQRNNIGTLWYFYTLLNC